MNNFIAWVEIPSVDFNRAIAFYNQILELDLVPLDCGTEKMACLPNDEGAIIWASGFEPSKQGVVVSFNTKDDLDATIIRIKKAGGQIIQPKKKIEAEGRGYFALFIDSEGNRLGLYGDN